MTVTSSSHPGPDVLDGLDSTAQLMTRFTAQLRTQLRSVRPPRPLPACADAGAPVLVAVAHGSRDPAAQRTVETLLASVRAMRPGLRVELGHIELNEPALSGTLAGLPAGSEAVLVPLLFGRGHHVKHDIPRALAGASHLRATVAQPLGPHPLLAAALHDRLREAGWPDSAGTDWPGPAGTDWPDPAGTGSGGSAPARSRSGSAVVLATAGSRDPESALGAERTAEQLRERLSGAAPVPVLCAYASAARPTVAEAVQQLRADGHSRIAVASCFTAPGHFAARCAAEAPWIAAAPLGAHPALARLVLHRFDEARAAGAAGRGAGAAAGAGNGTAGVSLVRA